MRLDLLDARVIATLATVGDDGLPYLSAVWFVRDGDDLLVATGGRTRKALNAAARPQAAMLVHGRGERPLHGLAASGYVTVTGGGEARALNERVWRKYLTSGGRAHPDLGEAIAGHDDLSLRFTPREWRAWSTAVDFGGAFELPGLVQPLQPLHPTER
ncbi:MAG TPA: pyridoxamine 5'-phosphate oxidase family protein [Gaiellaceae bacterium]